MFGVKNCDTLSLQIVTRRDYKQHSGKILWVLSYYWKEGFSGTMASCNSILFSSANVIRLSA